MKTWQMSSWGARFSLLWAILYFALVPLFAIIYMRLPSHSFYHSTAKFEQAIINDRERVEDGLTTAIIVQGRNHRAPLHGGWYVEDVRVTEYSVTDDAFSTEPPSFRVDLTLRKNNKREHSEEYIFTRATFVRNSLLVTVTPNGDALATRALVIEPISLLEGGIIRAVDIVPESRYGSVPNGTELHFPLSLERRMVDYRQAHSGFPTLSSSAQLKRMLYLSVTTLTTVGYGDVVPLSDSARLATAIEAIAGIVFIGLFLNSLTARARDIRQVAAPNLTQEVVPK